MMVLLNSLQVSSIPVTSFYARVKVIKECVCIGVSYTAQHILHVHDSKYWAKDHVRLMTFLGTIPLHYSIDLAMCYDAYACLDDIRTMFKVIRYSEKGSNEREKEEATYMYSWTI